MPRTSKKQTHSRPRQKYDSTEIEGQRYAPDFQKLSAQGGKEIEQPGRENEPRREEPDRENNPSPTEPPDYRDEPPPEERSAHDKQLMPEPAYSGADDNNILNDEEIDRGDYFLSSEDLGRNHQKARRLSQDDVEEWQNKGMPARGRSSRAFEEEIGARGYHDENRAHSQWHDADPGRVR